MGRRVYNILLSCDFATPEKHSAIELHMELPIPYSDMEIMQGWFGKGEWDAAENYLVRKYPEHRALLGEWLAGCKYRSERTDTLAKLAAVA